MLIRARRPQTLSSFSVALVLLMLFLLSTLPVAANGSVQPSPDHPDSSSAFKHPVLDSELARMAYDVANGRRSSAVAARSADVVEDDRVAVSIRTTAGTAIGDVIARLSEYGVEIANAATGVIEAYVPVSALTSVSAIDGVVTIRRIVPPVSQIVSQGVGLHGSLDWNTNGFSGAGVKVGIIDVGFIGYSNLIGSELPQPVVNCYRLIGKPDNSLTSCERGESHGTAVAETLIDVAPDVQLYIANPLSLLDLNATVDWMIEQGVQVINHSVVWIWEGPGDGTSPYVDGALAAIEKATDAGILWVNAAGNQGNSTWAGAFTDLDGDSWLDFGPDDENIGISVSAGKEIVLQMRWDDSWTNADSDLDVFLVNEQGTVIKEAVGVQAGSDGQSPFEFFRYTPAVSGTVYVEVKHHSGDIPDWLQIQELSGWSFEYVTRSGTIANPAESSSPGMLAVGAAPWTSPSSLESFSNQGPTRDGRIKPDIVGIDFADTATYGSSGFSGTSQASPHVAGLAALVEQRYPQYGAVELATYLTSTATRASQPDNQWGYGLARLLAVDSSTDNPAPVLATVSPSTIVASVEPADIVVTGSGFVPTSVVRVNGINRPTTYVSATELRVTISAIESTGGGDLEIVVFSPMPGGGPSNAVTLQVSIGSTADVSAFERRWERTDAPVAELQANRTWMWGQSSITGTFSERYDDSPEQRRTVTYYDKSRMEITDPDADPSWLWYVTNGLLVKELITGQMQVGETASEPREPAEVNVAGDPNDSDAPTYASLAPLLDAAPLDDGAAVVQRLDRNGNVSDDPSLEVEGVTAASRVTVEGIDHQVASVFWDFMMSSGLVYQDGAYVEDALFENPFYATGYPITEAYWVNVAVGGVEQDVLVQCFERRCLTYTPSNVAGWEVEAGNVGQHYFRWRYGIDPVQP